MDPIQGTDGNYYSRNESGDWYRWDDTKGDGGDWTLLGPATPAEVAQQARASSVGTPGVGATGAGTSPYSSSADPNQVYGTSDYWIDYEHLDKNGQPLLTQTEPADVRGERFWDQSRPSNKKHVVVTTYADGRQMQSVDGGQPTYAGIDNNQQRQWIAQNKPLTTSTWEDPTTGAQWKVDAQGNKVGKLSGPIEGWMPGAGVQRPSQRAPRDPEELEYDQLRNQEMRQKLSGELTPWQKIEWDYKKQQDAQERQQWEQQQQLAKQRAAWEMASDQIANTVKAAPMAAIPGQQYFLGAEPGGILQNIARLSGRSYNPETYRAPMVPFDPNAAWQQAWGVVGGK